MKFQSEIEAAWFGPLKMDELTQQFVCSRSYVEKVWREAKGAGRIPAGIARPSFFGKSGSVLPVEDDDSDLDFETMTEAEFNAYERRQAERAEHVKAANVASSDAFLAALRCAHGSPALLARDIVEPDRLALARQRREQRERCAAGAGLGSVKQYEVRA